MTVTGDAGTGVSYLEARYGWFGVTYLVSGCYRDKYNRTADAWGFQEMDIDLYYTIPAGSGWTSDEMHYLDPAFGRN